VTNPGGPDGASSSTAGDVLNFTLAVPFGGK
jgi:hypothetical protein